MKLKWNDSFPLRLAIRTGIFLAIVLFFITAASYISVAWLLSKNVNANLLVEAHSIISRWTQTGTIESFSWKKGFYRVIGPDGRVILEQDVEEYSHEKMELLDKVGPHTPPLFTYHLEREARPRTGWQAFLYELFPFEHGYREVYVPFVMQSNEYLLELAMETEDTRELLRMILLLLAAIAGAGFLLIISVVAYSSREGFRPIRQIARMVKTIEEKTLSTRLKIPVRDKTLDDLVGVINGMLDRLEQAFQSQSRFVQDASHELRTPLAVLRSDIEITLRRPRTAEEYQTSLKRCLEEVEHMTHMTGQLLALARYEQAAKLDLQPVNLHDVLARVIAKSRLAAEAKQVYVQYEPASDIKVTGEPVALEMAFLNLVQNAIHAVDVGGTVKLHVRKKETTIVTEISDNGPGIPEEKIPYLFDRFFRIDEGRNRQSGGTGLGLTITHTIIQAHQGTIGVKSRVGEGTTFSVELPSQAI